jgi:hypothetical protein
MAPCLMSAPIDRITLSALASTLGGILQTLDLRWFDVADYRFGILRQSSGQVLISNFEVALLITLHRLPDHFVGSGENVRRNS